MLHVGYLAKGDRQNHNVTCETYPINNCHRYSVFDANADLYVSSFRIYNVYSIFDHFQSNILINQYRLDLLIQVYGNCFTCISDDRAISNTPPTNKCIGLGVTYIVCGLYSTSPNEFYFVGLSALKANLSSQSPFLSGTQMRDLRLPPKNHTSSIIVSIHTHPLLFFIQFLGTAQPHHITDIHTHQHPLTNSIIIVRQDPRIEIMSQFADHALFGICT